MRTTLIASAALTACTGGFITQQNGSQWTPADDGSTLNAAVVTFSNATATYQVWTTSNSEKTSFSFDPGAAAMTTGTEQTNNSTTIAKGNYAVTVASDHVWKAPNVAVNNGNVCPFDDYYNGESTYCQLFQFELLDCNVVAQAPYQSGDFTVVQMAQTNSGQCGPRSCQYDVVDVAKSFVSNPAIAEVYVGCNGAAGCTTAPNTGLVSSVTDASAASTAFWSRMVEYGAGVASYGNAYNLTQYSFPKVVSDSFIESTLPAAISAGYIKAPSSISGPGNHAMFVIYLPSTSCAGACGGSSHHWQFSDGSGNYYNVALIAGYSSASAQDAAASHEIAEATTDVNDYDPGCGTNTGCGWNVKGMYEGEIADLCEDNGTDTIAGHSVAKVWSQAQCACL
jgi:hypothetical protein